MPICNDNFNGCWTGPYYPRPIFNCGQGGSCGGPNNVINPPRTAEWGFFIASAGAVSQNQPLPLTLSNSSGSAITQTEVGSFNLTAGSYNVSFNVTGSSSVNPMRFGLELNGSILPYSIVTAAGDGTAKSLSNALIVTDLSNFTLRLVNLTGGQAEIESASLAVTKLLA